MSSCSQHVQNKLTSHLSVVAMCASNNSAVMSSCRLLSNISFHFNAALISASVIESVLSL